MGPGPGQDPGPSYLTIVLNIDGQVCLVHLAHLQIDNFRLFLRQQTNK